MKALLYWAFAGLILVQAESASALSGNELKSHLNSDPGFNTGVAAGYMEGVIDARSKEICLPSRATKGQMVGIVQNFLNAHPEALHQSAADIVFIAITKAWPCR